MDEGMDEGMDVVMGAANRAEPTIQGLDTRSVMQDWSMWGSRTYESNLGVMFEQ